MLIDRCVIEVRSGKGGDGAISFLQDKNTQKGGPDGGNGGRGGSIYFVGKANLNNLYNFRHSRTFIALDGEKGGKKLMNGKGAPDLYIEVPTGTVISLESTGEILADLTEEGQTALIAQGGRGGKGNACYKSSRRRIPRIAENGHPGERKRLILELKMIADAGLIGFPSVGKSTLLNVISRANVPTADYPFTTLIPNLGIANLKDGRSFVAADMPGLIRGAHEGKGLGITFLRHIERCRVLVHVVSMDGERDPYEDYLAINEELVRYGKGLKDRPMLVVASKMDSEGAEERKAEFDQKLGFPSIGISALTHENIDLFLYKTMDLIEKTPKVVLEGEEELKYRVYDARKSEADTAISVTETKSHYWVISGQEVERKAALINTSTEEGEEQLIRYLDSVGIEELLQEAGVKDGDTVKINDFEFIYTI